MLSENIKSRLSSIKGKCLSSRERQELAIELASLMLKEGLNVQTWSEKRKEREIAGMIHDLKGKTMLTAMVDQCFRSLRNDRVADQLTHLLQKYGIPKFLSLDIKIKLFLFKILGESFANLFVPLAKRMLRREVRSVIIPGEEKILTAHIRKRMEVGVKVNLNHLGETILGEEEAQHRLETYLRDLTKPEVDYISVKISSICSQLNLLSWDYTLSILEERLRTLYRSAMKHEIPKFVNLDMEEYRDLFLTFELFKKVLSEEEFFHHSAGIVLQAYIPDSFRLQQELTEWAKERLSRGGAPIKIRIVKGANLASEKVEASLRLWPQAPYSTKLEVDANFKAMIEYGCQPENAKAVHLGIGSHNLFDIAWVMILSHENEVEQSIIFEMLEGMADHLRRVVGEIVGDVLVYCPTATKREFVSAISYLIRRFDENTAPNNFLRHLFDLEHGSEEWNHQVENFRNSCQKIKNIDYASRRQQNRFESSNQLALDEPFRNEPTTDWTPQINRKWAEEIVEKWGRMDVPPLPLVIGGKEVQDASLYKGKLSPVFPDRECYHYSMATLKHADQALKTAKENEKSWAECDQSEREKILINAVRLLRKRRNDLIGAMAFDTGKIISEADVEVSEAIDFGEYYLRMVREWCSYEDLSWQPKGTVLVAPPWNFPCAIPFGCTIAALATGNCVLFKPAPESILVGWHLVNILWEAGVEKKILQFITCDEDSVGNAMIQDERLNCVVLTGGTATAKKLLKLRPGLDLVAETGGKNSIIVTSMADRDLAIKDIVQSAFSHAGQKCSACSLLILESELYEDEHFLHQLRDAAASLKLGSPFDLSTLLNPLIRFPGMELFKGLTQLDPGETWLLEPKQDPNHPLLWSPGIKTGVKQGNFSYTQELFGPVLSVLRANNLKHAIQLANGTSYGLTAGIHTLDDREQQYWINYIEAGNCYINRPITGSIVRRQPFGGCKESSFGMGLKAGGPNYVTQLMKPIQIKLPKDQEKAPHFLSDFFNFFGQTHLTEEQKAMWTHSIRNYMYAWNHHFFQKHDPSRVIGEDNILTYVPHHQVAYRKGEEDTLIDILRMMSAAEICATFLSISGEGPIIQELQKYRWPRKIVVLEEDQSRFYKRIKSEEIKRIRFFNAPSEALLKELSEIACNVMIAPVIANGRIELLHYLREVSISHAYHRYGNLGERERLLI